jgi:hypothetical protein
VGAIWPHTGAAGGVTVSAVAGGVVAGGAVTGGVVIVGVATVDCIMGLVVIVVAGVLEAIGPRVPVGRDLAGAGSVLFRNTVRKSGGAEVPRFAGASALRSVAAIVPTVGAILNVGMI